MTPSAVRREDVLLKAYPRITFQIEINGDDEMNYKFIEKDAFTIVGKKETVEMASERDEFNPEMWKALEMVEEEVAHYDNTSFNGVMHVSYTNRAGDIEYYIGAASTKEPSEGMETLIISPQTWAVFEVSGKMPETLLSTWERVYTEWFPTSGYELAEAPELIRGQDEQTEIWIPVKKSR